MMMDMRNSVEQNRVFPSWRKTPAQEVTCDQALLFLPTHEGLERSLSLDVDSTQVTHFDRKKKLGTQHINVHHSQTYLSGDRHTNNAYLLYTAPAALLLNTSCINKPFDDDRGK